MKQSLLAALLCFNGGFVDTAGFLGLQGLFKNLGSDTNDVLALLQHWHAAIRIRLSTLRYWRLLMSFDIFLQCFQGGEPATFKRSLFEEIFCPNAINPQLPLEDVTYADGGGDIYGSDDDDIQCLMFNHCGGDTFWAALRELADRTQSVVFSASGWPTLAVADAAAIAHLPANFTKDSPNSVHVVRSGRELEELIYGPREPQEDKA